MEENKYILSDKAIMDLTEGCPMSEGGTLDEFMYEAAVVAKAVEEVGVNLKQLRPTSRALFLMRAFYFLGIIRGGESYREEIYTIDELDSGVFSSEVRENCHFSMVDWMAQDMAEELDAPELEDRKKLVKLLDLEKADG